MARVVAGGTTETKPRAATTALTEKAAITITATAEAGPAEEVTRMVAGEATVAVVEAATNKPAKQPS